ncbi:hypothetical protein B0T26DRAFT_756688 [Lasiosphaeria miniovina]|uniref:Uncharacterized protein n=1 Tax=Lasiosphaeria miniovina TaxID=1954250 RepID=A0AA39ZSY8_9PEZI|nr:uncharacterized protein B0T26DRAFT_756688 [Lasiosphaeria miniovina]KAK0703126.1 hypothetical protein B0T26DRAFT_756688 [Lasiosphaeria miniovina]
MSAEATCTTCTFTELAGVVLGHSRRRISGSRMHPCRRRAWMRFGDIRHALGQVVLRIKSMVSPDRHSSAGDRDAFGFRLQDVPGSDRRRSFGAPRPASTTPKQSATKSKASSSSSSELPAPFKLPDGEHEYLTEKTEFGDSWPDAEARNVRQSIVAVFD